MTRQIRQYLDSRFRRQIAYEQCDYFLEFLFDGVYIIRKDRITGKAESALMTNQMVELLNGNRKVIVSNKENLYSNFYY